MIHARYTPLRAFGWAILLGVVAFTALFYVSFISMSERESDLVRVSSRQDSLLLSIFHVMRGIEDDEFEAPHARLRLQATWSDFDSILAAEQIVLRDGSRRALEAFRAYGEMILDDPSRAGHDRRYLLLLDLESELGSQLREMIGEENREFRMNINLWVGLSTLIVVAGFGFMWWFGTSRSREEEAYARLSSILQVSESPVVVYDADGRASFTNAAFRKHFLGGAEAITDRRADRLYYLDTTAEEGRSIALWESLTHGLRENPSWDIEVPFTAGGKEKYFRLYAIGRHNAEDELSEIVVMHSDISAYRNLHTKAKEVEDQYRSIVENSPDALVLLQDEEVVYANASALDLFGFRSTENISEQRFADLFGSAGNLAFHVPMTGRRVGDQILQNAEFRATTRQGTLIDVEASASIVRWGENLALQATFRDITERKMLEREQALWSWEQDALSEIDRRLVGVVDLNTILASIIQQVLNLSRAQWAGILMYDGSERMVTWRAMGGNTREENPRARFEVTPAIRAVFAGAEPLVVQELKDQQRISMASLPGLSGEGIISSMWLPLRVGERQEGVLAVGYRSYHSFIDREMRLLTSLAEKTAIALANASLYENLLEREQELEVLSGARVDAQEEERRRIAREIHDGLGQILTAIKLNVEIMEDSPGIGEGERARFDDVKKLLDSVMKEAREISYDLMPSVLEDFGLIPALQLLAERFGSQSSVRVQFFHKGSIGRLGQRMEVALYRIVQEALTNSVRHGKAQLITIQIVVAGGTLRLTIEDNGQGMDEGMQKMRRSQGGGIGLASMRERVNSFNGTLEIDSSPGKGTLIVVELPLDAQTGQRAP